VSVQSHLPAVEFSGVTSRLEDVPADILFVPVFQDEDRGDLGGLNDATGGELERAMAAGEFRARAYDVFVTPIVNRSWKAHRVGLVGAGKRTELDAERVRRIAACASYAARRRSAASVAWALRGLDLGAAQHVADGLSAAEFDGGSYKHDPAGAGKIATHVTIVAPGADARALADHVQRGRVIGEAANFSRALCNEPGNVLTPREFAARVAAAARAGGLGVDVLEEKHIRDLEMNLLLGVAAGSAEPPRVIVVRHEPPNAPASPVLGFVGKGITFDSGGISIKPADGMERMKDDMAGGAAVAGAMLALARLNAPCRVIGVIPTTENMPGGRATRPGDVIVGASGKSVEVINTDAEGRLILGDALWYAQRLGATHLVDIATLTGACMVALGRHVSGLFGQPESWVGTVKQAAARGGDRVWHMPIYEEAREQIRSDIADILNSAGRPGGAVTAAAFLREFVGDLPWAHLDVAGTAWAETKENYQPKGATGVAVRLLIELGLTGGRNHRAIG
jgi:leucyl aminopeptidase